jgi:hypothetical protein
VRVTYRHLLDTNHVQGQVALEVHDGIDDHLGEEVRRLRNELGRHARRRALHQQIPERPTAGRGRHVGVPGEWVFGGEEGKAMPGKDIVSIRLIAARDLDSYLAGAIQSKLSG